MLTDEELDQIEIESTGNGVCLLWNNLIISNPNFIVAIRRALMDRGYHDPEKLRGIRPEWWLYAALNDFQKREKVDEPILIG